MGTGHRVHADLGAAVHGGSHLLRNPGTGNTINLEDKSEAFITLSAGTYTLPDTDAGRTLTVYATGAVTLQSELSATVATIPSGGLARVVATTTTTWATLAEDLRTTLTTTLGHISIPLMTVREASGMDVGAIAANGGLLASDTTPLLEAINGATDGCQRIVWAAGNSDAIIFQVTLPADFDDSQILQVYFRTAMGGATDTPTCTLNTYWDEGDTKVVDTEDWDMGTTYSNTNIAVAAADIPSSPTTVTCEFVPGTHANDAIYVTGIYLRYVKKLLTS